MFLIGTGIIAALNYARITMLKNTAVSDVRRDAKKIVLFITDGVCTVPPKPNDDICAKDEVDTSAVALKNERNVSVSKLCCISFIVQLFNILNNSTLNTSL